MTSMLEQLLAWLKAFLDHFTVNDATAMGRINGALLAGFATAGLGATGAVGVAIARWVMTQVRFLVSRHVIVQKLTLEPVQLSTEEAERVEIYCLLIRFGTDLYFEKLASDQERFEGRLQNRILRNRASRTDREDGRVDAHFSLPIHNRLGTQFKFFLEVEELEPPPGGVMMKVSDKIEEAQRRERYFRIGLSGQDASEMLVTMGENAERAAAAASAPAAEKVFDEQSKAYRIACALADAYGLPRQDVVRRYKRKPFGRSVLCYRLWFTLADFPRVRTADGLENNMAFPI